MYDNEVLKRISEPKLGFVHPVLSMYTKNEQCIVDHKSLFCTTCFGLYGHRRVYQITKYFEEG